MPEELIRELFIGLGGTGGNALQLLYAQMSEEQRRTAKYVFIDTDQKAIDKMEISGIRSIRISSADTVRQVAESLGADDGVLDWLPNGSNERKFLNSRLDDGASQCRFKSRLCLARFLEKDAPGLRELLEEMTRPGVVTENTRLRVAIVASIAGGTGAGTFIQMALYIRKFFRNLGQQAEIIGIFSCPDLYLNFAENDIEKTSMFANAYAAIRELNAMNLATNPPEDPRGPRAGRAEQKKSSRNLRGYGMKVDIKLRTKSEGLLFDSKELSFQMDESAKPFDLIYFVDKANEKGGILKNIHEYYRIMADIAYTRLYSPMNAAIASGESNELRNHTLVPTAIYGSAGYARILYPYRDIIRYLAEQKLYDELGNHWLYLDALWDAECQMEQDAARAFGGQWSPKPGQRGRKFQDDLNAELRGEKSRFAFLKGMIYGRGNISKVQTFSGAISKAAMSLSVAKDDHGVAQLPTDPAILRASGGKYSVLRNSDVVRMVTEMAELANAQSAEDSSDAASPFAPLLSVSAQVENTWGEFAAALEAAVKTQSQKLASAILPLSDVALGNHDATSPISLHHALLSGDGGNDVHPLAARYLLYGMQELCLTQGSSDKDALKTALERSLRKIQLALDDDKDDDEDITVEMAVEENENRWMRRRTREAIAREMLTDFCDELKANLVQALLEADKAVVRGAYAELSEPINELVSLYEGFFLTIAPYRDELHRLIYTDLNRHDGGGNQTIYVGASSTVKRVYSVDPSVVGALTSDPDAAYAAAGSGVYENLYQRLRKRMADKALSRSLGEFASAVPQEQFKNMGEVFHSILAKYEELLDRNDTVLKTNAVGALINEICAELEITRGEIESSASTRQRFDEKFRDHITDLKAKARPMIRYNETNSQNYFLEEVEGGLLNVSKTYCNFGFSPVSAEAIGHYYPTDSVDTLSAFHSRMSLDRDDSLLIDDEYNDNEIFCFSAVHCLQPTQIYHFLEDQQEDSYYPHYKARIASELLSDSPHLDKRWNQRGAMPYISANLELQWRHVVMKAMIYEVLRGIISFTVDRNNIKCFIRQEGDSNKLLYWPRGEQILTRNISRLVEYLAEDEERVELEAERMDNLVASYVRSLYNSEDPNLYKQGMTKDRILTLLRGDMISFLQTDNSIRDNGGVAHEDGDTYVDYEKTLGGVLHVAYLLHQSEERLFEDKDYGETLLAAAADIVDKYALGMHGSYQACGGSEQHREYVEIYNWTIEQFLTDWLKRAEVEYGADSDEESSAAQDQESVRESASYNSRLPDRDEPVMTTSTGHNNVPECIRRTREYIWITNNWKYKSFQE